MTDKPQVLYRMYDQFDRLLYVGITMDPIVRFQTHRADKSWWPQVANISLEHFDRREDVEAAEAQAILEEQPLYNVVGRPLIGPAKPPRSGRGTARQTIRVDEELWAKFGEAADEVGSDRSAIARELFRWFVRERGAKLPPRPDR